MSVQGGHPLIDRARLQPEGDGDRRHPATDDDHEAAPEDVIVVNTGRVLVLCGVRAVGDAHLAEVGTMLTMAGDCPRA